MGESIGVSLRIIVPAKWKGESRTGCGWPSNFGSLAILPDTRLHWDYVSSHMLTREHEWPVRVITRFLNTLRYLKENA